MAFSGPGRAPSYLFRKAGLFYFRMAVPLDLVADYGRNDVRLSLGTALRGEARPLARCLAVATQQFFQQMRVNVGMQNLSYAEKQEALRGYLLYALGEDKRMRLEPPNAPDYLGPWDEDYYRAWKGKGKSERRFKIREAIREAIANADTQLVEDELKSYFDKSDMHVDPASLPFKEFCYDVLCLLPKLFDMLDWRDAGDEPCFDDYFPQFVSVREQPPAVGARAVEPANSPERLGPTLADAAEEYVKAQWEHWADTSRVELPRHVREFVAIVDADAKAQAMKRGREHRPVQVGELERKHVRSYTEVVLRLPNRRAPKKWQGLDSLEYLNIELNDVHKLSGKTINNRYTNIKTFLNFLKKEYERSVPKLRFIDGLKDVLTVPKKRNAEGKGKAPFTRADLKRVFSHEGYVGGGKAFNLSYQYWLPLLGLYTGARIEELCQLHLSDVRQVDGVWVLDINDKMEKRLKNANAKRVVPIHPDLIELGLLNRVDRLEKLGKKLLFPKLAKEGEDAKYSKRVGNWFGRFLNKQGVPRVDRDTEKTKSFHSFRHTVITELENGGLPEAWVNQLTGQAKTKHKGIGTYRHGLKASELRERVVLRLDFSDALDIEAMKGSRWVGLP